MKFNGYFGFGILWDYNHKLVDIYNIIILWDYNIIIIWFWDLMGL